MSYLIRAAPPEHFDWFVERTKHTIASDFRAIEALDERGRIRGIVGFEHWTPNAVQVHMVGESPIAVRRLMVPAFEYAFLQTGRGLMCGAIRADNAQSLALTRALGFREVYRQRDGWAPGSDVLFFELRKEECRWLNGVQRRAA